MVTHKSTRNLFIAPNTCDTIVGTDAFFRDGKSKIVYCQLDVLMKERNKTLLILVVLFISSFLPVFAASPFPQQDSSLVIKEASRKHNCSEVYRLPKPRTAPRSISEPSFLLLLQVHNYRSLQYDYCRQ